MIIKRHSNFHAAFAILSLVLTSSIMLTGCKNDKREKIDLSSIHTTGAAETMAPKTRQPTTEAVSIVPEASEAGEYGSSDTSGIKNNDLPPASNVSVRINTHTSGKVSIEYPSVVNLTDSAKTASIDKLLKDNALSILMAYGINDAQDSLTVKCNVLSADRSRITAIYTGIYQAKDAPYPINLFYSNTIDVNKADNIGFDKFADPYTMAGYVLSSDCTFYNASPEITAELIQRKNDTSIEAYTKLFSQADFPYSDTFPESFSYENEGTIFFSIPVPHALGDYAIVMYTPDTK